MSQPINWQCFAPAIITLGLAGNACGPGASEETASRQQWDAKPVGDGRVIQSPPIRGYYWGPTDTWLPEGNVHSVMSVAIQATPSLLAAFGTTGAVGATDTVQVRAYSSVTHLWDAAAVVRGRYAALSNDLLAVGTPEVNVTIYGAPTFARHMTLTPSLPMAGSEFGRSLAIDGSTLVVGAPSYNLGEGRAFIFELLPSGIWFLPPFWRQTAVLGEPSPASPAVPPVDESLLGAAVGVSGSVVAVGQTPEPPEKGRVFLFEKQATGWVLVDTVFAHDPVTALVPTNSDAKADSFGKALLVKGNTLAVRSDRYVQLFTRNTNSGKWTFTSSFDVGLSSSSYWDRPLAFDGTELISGDSLEPLSYSGRVHPLLGTLAHSLHTFPPNPFIEESPPQSGASFGQCIATAGGWLLVADAHKHIRVYTRTAFY